MVAASFSPDLYRMPLDIFTSILGAVLSMDVSGCVDYDGCRLFHLVLLKVMLLSVMLICNSVHPVVVFYSLPLLSQGFRETADRSAVILRVVESTFLFLRVMMKYPSLRAVVIQHIMHIRVNLNSICSNVAWSSVSREGQCRNVYDISNALTLFGTSTKISIF